MDYPIEALTLAQHVPLKRIYWRVPLKTFLWIGCFCYDGCGGDVNETNHYVWYNCYAYNALKILRLNFYFRFTNAKTFPQIIFQFILWFPKQHLSFSAINSFMLSVMSYELKIDPILLKLVTPKKYKYWAMRRSE